MMNEIANFGEDGQMNYEEWIKLNLRDPSNTFGTNEEECCKIQIYKIYKLSNSYKI